MIYLITKDICYFIKEKEYALRFKGKTAERKEYTGRILAVGISYNSKTKEHECKIEQL